MPTPTKELRAAVIGLGFIGAGDQVSGDAIGQKVENLDGTHAGAFANHPQIQLVTGSSRDIGRRQRFEERFGIDKTYADWREMIATEKLDIVGIATNSPYHAEIAIACARAGIPAILCDKPIATRLSDADRAVQACRDSNTLLTINHGRRFDPLWQAARDAIRENAVGVVRHVNLQWGSGRLGNIGTHIFDITRFLLDAEPVEVSGKVDPDPGPDCRGPQYLDPGGWGAVSFTKDIKVFVNAAKTPKLPLQIKILGSLAHMTINASGAHIEHWGGAKRSLEIEPDGHTSMDRAVQHMVRCLTEGEEPISTGADGIAALEVIVGFHVSSLHNGQEVKIPIAGEGRELEVLIG